MKSRLLLVICHDIAAILVAWWLAFLLRYNLEFSAGQWQVIGQTLPWVAAIQAAAFWRFGLYRGLWRFASLPDLKRILLAVGFSVLTVALALFLVGRMENVPRSVLLLDPLLLVLIMGGSRFLYRSWKDGHLFSLRDASSTPVLIIGSGEAAAMLLRDLGRSRDWRAVGLFDDDAGKHGRWLSGVPVLGPVADIGRHAARFEARHAIVAMPSSTAAERRRATELAAEAGLTVMTVPALDDILSGRVAISQIRKVELEDLLGREPVALDNEGLSRLLSGKVVLVTGAGGSIGSELARQIARFSPTRLVFYELSEFALYAIEQEFADSFPACAVACAVGDVKDAARLSAVFEKYRPDVVFHAAAYKHVPMMENENAWEAVRNNVLGTLATARAAIAYGAGEFVLISTDKAVNPTNVMGTSKRLAERVCQSLQREAADTRFVMVRFGNVLGSSGSVIPKFREQIAKGGPVTVTHPDIIRYFMLIPEAAQLVLQAGLMAAEEKKNGGKIFVLDMGEPVRIADLARDMIRLSGFSEDDIRIEFTGLRPGEKLYEELLADGESTLPTPHPKLRIARPDDAPDAAWLASLEAWLEAPVRSEAETKDGLRARVPEYSLCKSGS
ncbi:MAG: polysaccharide biosynthesis protein [Candidatus Nitricoxidivorans perseverans]|uniref:Polysaccharide biosynthesis protein n=1 Tax=Candidatus Nitricoxidivorans perseverans TaxID=2975601 RepID=A0AA49FJ98_9PROT|nr:MAG: polysaccharide biosynthesis protein [Candidatus Nitricoxidivorans perseverans]